MGLEFRGSLIGKDNRTRSATYKVAGIVLETIRKTLFGLNNFGTVRKGMT